MLDRAAIEQEITLWSDLYEWHPDDMTRGLLNRLLGDAITSAQKAKEAFPSESPNDELFAVLMALLVEQEKVLSNWSKIVMKKR